MGKSRRERKRAAAAAPGMEVPTQGTYASLFLIALSVNPTYGPVRGTVDALISSGRLGILRNREIRNAVASWGAEVDDATEEEIQQTDLVFTFRERVFGLGTIGFATAGTGFHEAYWLMLAQPLDVHQKVVETIGRYGR